LTISNPEGACRQGFYETFGYQPAGLWSAPGRVNLIGEHTDYNSGFVLPIAIDKRTYAAVSLTGTGQIRVASRYSDQIVSIKASEISKSTVAGWSAYPLGVAYAFFLKCNSSTGFDLYIESNVPVGAGLSSSAALECSVATALNDLLETELDLAELAQIGKLAENEIVGAPTGIMDQTASLFAQEDSAVFLDCKTLDLELVPVRFHESKLKLLIIDTRVSHRLVDGGYADRRESCERGAQTLGVSSLRELTISDLSRAEESLSEKDFRRVRHVVTENFRVVAFVSALRQGEFDTLGKLMVESHSSMRDDFEISIPELDLAVETSMERGAIGSRMTGGGFGGAAIALAPEEVVEGISESVISKFSEHGFAEPRVFEVTASAGARKEA
jgi:galactokinase